MKDLLQELETLGFERTLPGLNIPHTYVDCDCRNNGIDSILVYSEDCSIAQVKKEKTGGFKVTPCKSILYSINSGPIMIVVPPGMFYYFNDIHGVLDYICKATLNGSFLDKPEENLQSSLICYKTSTSSSWSSITTTYNL